MSTKKVSAFAAELKEWRRAAGITQRLAAAWLGVGVRTLQQWEQGRRKPDHVQMLRHRMGDLAADRDQKR